LRERGHEHLASIADKWSGDARSKTYINRLKLRLAFWYPDKYRPIVINEAHVRLVTSTWYMAQALWKIAGSIVVFILIPAAVTFGLTRGVDAFAASKWVFDSSVPTLIVIAVALYSRRACEAFVHYQRLREVFVVLELAHTADTHAPILEDAAPRVPAPAVPQADAPDAQRVGA
jgi:hypothetical protein